MGQADDSIVHIFWIWNMDTYVYYILQWLFLVVQDVI